MVKVPPGKARTMIEVPLVDLLKTRPRPPLELTNRIELRPIRLWLKIKRTADTGLMTGALNTIGAAAQGYGAKSLLSPVMSYGGGFGGSF